jgi:hypothetical protein
MIGSCITRPVKYWSEASRVGTLPHAVIFILKPRFPINSRLIQRIIRLARNQRYFHDALAIA